jgi:uncharacterized membrane protein YdbT with pleckstrin-like domain
MTYPDRLLTEDEHIVRQFRPHWRMLAIPILWAIAAIVASILLFVYIPDENRVIAWIGTGLMVAALVPLTIVPIVQWWFTAYVLTNERLITRKGVISKAGIEISLENISNVWFKQNVLERLLRSGDLLIESAGETGQSRFSDIPDPEGFQSLLYRTREERTAALNRDASAPAPPAGDDPTSKLERLAQLHRDGALTDEEFAAKKQALLDEI